MTTYSICDYKQCGKKIEKNTGWSMYLSNYSEKYVSLDDNSNSFDLCAEHGEIIKKEIMGNA